MTPEVKRVVEKALILRRAGIIWPHKTEMKDSRLKLCILKLDLWASGASSLSFGVMLSQWDDRSSIPVDIL